MGEELEFNTVEGGSVRARIVSPVFYDPEGEKTECLRSASPGWRRAG